MAEKTLAQHFHEYFSICIADTIDLKKEVFELRCDVYCTELGYEKVCQHFENSENCEIDDFDRYSEHVLIRHKASGIYAGCVRLVTPPPHDPKALLPFEANCSQSFDPKKVAFLRAGENVKICEFSRLAVRSIFRRRVSDAKTPDGINAELISQEKNLEGSRYFPVIAVALYFAGTSIAISQNIKYGFVMMETRLARLMKLSGINYIQLGETMDYHGQRALFYTGGAFIDSLKPELKELYQSVDQLLTHNVSQKPPAKPEA